MNLDQQYNNIKLEVNYAWNDYQVASSMLEEVEYFVFEQNRLYIIMLQRYSIKDRCKMHLEWWYQENKKELEELILEMNARHNLYNYKLNIYYEKLKELLIFQIKNNMF